MRALISALGVCIGLSAPVASTADPVLVELYTSQGCSSCPPADKILGQLAGRDDVMALSLHVDYWDYLGWKDAFASPAFTARQQAYARAANSTMIFTPQMIVAGVDSVVGTRTMELMDRVAAHAKTASVVSISVVRSGDEIVLQGTVEAGGATQKVVQLVRYRPEQSVDIQRGENAGRTVTYHNVVTSWTVLGTWTGPQPLELTTPLEGDAPAVVVVQDGTSGPVLAVARVD